MNRIIRWGMLLALAALIPACATDSDAVLNDQNIKAGEYIEAHSLQPDVKQAGTDVKLNAQTLAKNTVGEAPAELKKPYTPDNSKTARDDSDKSHTSTIWPWISGALAILLPLAIGVAKLHPWGAVVAKIAEPFVRKLVDVHNDAELQPEDMLHRDDVQDHINDLMADPKAGPVAQKIMAKIGLEQQALQPTPPIPPVPIPPVA